VRAIERFMPAARWLRRYDRGDLTRDDAVLGRLRGYPGYRDIENRVDAPPFFASARFLRERVDKLIQAAEAPVVAWQRAEASSHPSGDGR
jgi:hypothetical protein